MKHGRVMLLFLLLLFLGGCASSSYYAGIEDQRDETAMSYHRSGTALAQQGAHKQAITEFRKAIKADPYLMDTYINLSRSHYALGNYEMAIFYNIEYTELQRSRDWSYALNVW